MTLSQPVMDALFCLERNDVSWHTVNNELHRLSDAESRLEAANALINLLRTGKDGKKYTCVESRDGSMVEVTTYLQGAGDE